MSFFSAFKYPFQNFAKVVSIALMLTIAIALCITLILKTHDWSPLLELLYGIEQPQSSVETLKPMSGSAAIGTWGLLLVVAISGFWLSGYSLTVVRSIMSQEERLPEVVFWRNIKDGVYLFVASAAYVTVFIILLAIVAIISSMLWSPLGLEFIFLLVVLPALFAVACVMGWGYYVGMARFAVEGNFRACRQIWRNMHWARRHPRAGLRLLLYMVGLTIFYGILFVIADPIVGSILDATIGSSPMASFTVWIIEYYLLNLLLHFSAQHLIAQYGLEVAVGADHYDSEKYKVDALTGMTHLQELN